MEELSEAAERRFLMAERPDGPVFGIVRAAEPRRAHVVVPSFICGRDEGWFYAHCYNCETSERFSTRETLSYFDPFTGDQIHGGMQDALRAGAAVRSEWMARRKALREELRAASSKRPLTR